MYAHIQQQELSDAATASLFLPYRWWYEDKGLQEPVSFSRKRAVSESQKFPDVVFCRRNSFMEGCKIWLSINSGLYRCDTYSKISLSYIIPSTSKASFSMAACFIPAFCIALFEPAFSDAHHAVMTLMPSWSVRYPITPVRAFVSYVLSIYLLYITDFC